MLTRWNDFGGLSRFGGRDFDTFDALRREMNRLFFDFEQKGPAYDTREWPRAWLEDKGSHFELRVEVPGVEDKDLELHADGSSVTVRGERKDAVPEGHSVHRKERGAFKFARSFTLPSKIDAERVEASLKNGVLNVTLPKAKEAQPRQISVRSAT